jgi:hypothetical protein
MQELFTVDKAEHIDCRTPRNPLSPLKTDIRKLSAN